MNWGFCNSFTDVDVNIKSHACCVFYSGGGDASVPSSFLTSVAVLFGFMVVKIEPSKSLNGFSFSVFVSVCCQIRISKEWSSICLKETKNYTR